LDLGRTTVDPKIGREGTDVYLRTNRFSPALARRPETAIAVADNAAIPTAGVD
jgi:hypothetical protein